MKLLSSFICCFFLVSYCWANQTAGSRHLTTQEIERVKALKVTLRDVDSKTLDQTISDLEKTGYPRLNLEIRETMAKAFVDIVNEQHVSGVKKKQWLYSMVTLNMAYLQMVGLHVKDDEKKEINKLIRYKLKTYLPKGIEEKKGFYFSPD